MEANLIIVNQVMCSIVIKIFENRAWTIGIYKKICTDFFIIILDTIGILETVKDTESVKLQKILSLYFLNIYPKNCSILIDSRDIKLN